MPANAVRTVGPGDRMHRRLMKDRSRMFSGCANASSIGKRSNRIHDRSGIAVGAEKKGPSGYPKARSFGRSKRPQRDLNQARKVRHVGALYLSSARRPNAVQSFL